MSSPRVCIIGAGVLGLSSALQLARRGAEVTVLEKDHVASGSSGRSIGVIGSQLLDPVEIELRVWGVHFLTELEEHGLEFTRTGYLRLGHDATLAESFERSADLQRSLGLEDSRVLDRSEIAARIPHLRTDDVELGLFGPQNGFIDGHLYAGLMAELCETLGVQISVREAVVGREPKPDDAQIIVTSKGRSLDCDYVVNAAGAWAEKVGEKLGAPVRILPEKAQAAMVETGEVLPYMMPLVMDFVPGVGGSGLNFRHERDGQLVVEMHTEAVSKVEDPDDFVPAVADEFYETVAKSLLDRLPGLPNARLGSGWAGLYPMSADGPALVGPHPDDGTVILAAGLSGYGIQLSPAVGNLVSEWILDGKPSTLACGEILSPSRPGRSVAA